MWKVNPSNTCETLYITFCSKIKGILNSENICHLSVWKRLIISSVLLLKRHKDEKLQNHGFKSLCVCFFYIDMQREVSCKVKTQIKIYGFCVNSLKILLVIKLLWGKI